MARKKINLEKIETSWDLTDPRAVESLKQMSEEELSKIGLSYWKDGSVEGFAFSAPPLKIDAPVRVVRSPRPDKTTITIEIDAPILDEPDKAKRKKLSENILRVVKVHLKDELRLKHYKAGPAVEIAPGIKRRRMVLADRGAEPKHEDEIEGELRRFFERRDAARAEIKATGNKVTKERMLIAIYPKNSDPESAWKRFRRRHNLTEKDLLGAGK